MAIPKPQKVIIEYNDGMKLESSFDDLPATLQSEILRQPFASRPSPNPENEKYLILEWDDGWKEVIQMDDRCADINRYYVISRPEDVGRLSINKQDDYPELIEITRKPMDLKRITFLDAFQISPDRSDREGSKTDHFFKLIKENSPLGEEMKIFKKAMEEEGIEPDELKSLDLIQAREQYEKLRRRMGLKAGQRQQDVFDFICYLAKQSW